MTYDVIIRDGLWFDGTGRAPQTRTLGVRDGVVATVSDGPLDETGCPDVIDAAGKWVLPGFLDVHTHYDAEVLLDPGLRESVRHGVTTNSGDTLVREWNVVGQEDAMVYRLRGYLDSEAGDQRFYRSKIATAGFYADQLLAQAEAWSKVAMAGDAAIRGFGDVLFE